MFQGKSLFGEAHEVVFVSSDNENDQHEDEPETAQELSDPEGQEQGNQSDSDDEAYNPFELPIEDRDDESDEEYRADNRERGEPGNEETPNRRRPNRWAIERLPVTFEKRPLTSRLKGHRQTYMAGAMYGGEDLNSIQELNFEDCDQPCPYCGALYWKAELSRTRQDVGLKCCTYGKYVLPATGTFREPSGEIIELFTGNSQRA